MGAGVLGTNAAHLLRLLEANHRLEGVMICCAVTSLERSI